MPILAALFAVAITQLTFGELFAKSTRPLPSERVQQLAGKRVRVNGFMASMEQPPRGAFWLCRKPLEIDEGGAGTGDLPLESILVVLTPSGSQPVAPVRGPLSVEGKLEVGRMEKPDGTVSLFRIVLDVAHSRKPKHSKPHKETQ